MSGCSLLWSFGDDVWFENLAIGKHNCEIDHLLFHGSITKCVDAAASIRFGDIYECFWAPYLQLVDTYSYHATNASCGWRIQREK